MNNLISVIIPVYNRSHTINRSIQSVLKQTYKDIEIVVVDDCSSDNSVSVISSIQDDRIRLIKHETNRGANAARNIGIIEARGELIAFQDSDDEWFNNKLEKQLEYFYAKEVDVVACAYYQNINDKVKRVPEGVIENGDLFDHLLYGNFIATPSILGKKECFTSYLFDENLPRFQDWEVMLRISKHRKVYFINEVLLNAYVLDDGITMSMRKGITAFSMILKKYENDYNNNEQAKKTIYRAMNYFAVQEKDFSVNYCKKGLLECGYDLKTFIRFCDFSLRKLLSWYSHL